MSLSKPFPLQMLPLLCFEKVLNQMYPIDLISLSMCSKRVTNRMSTVRLADFCRVEVDGDTAVIVITFQNGGTFKWCIQNETLRYLAGSELTMKYQDFSQYEKVNSIIVNEFLELEIFKINAADTFYSLAHVSGFGYEEEPFFDQLLSTFPCPVKAFRFSRDPEDWISDCIFDFYSLETCENLEVICYISNYFVDLLDLIEVTNKVTVISEEHSVEGEPNPPFDYGKLINLNELKLVSVGSYTDSMFLDQNHVHLELVHCSISPTVLKTFFKRWIDGEYTRLKTMKYQLLSFLDNYFSVVDELELHDPHFTPNDNRLVKFSSNLYIDATLKPTGPHFILKSRTVLLRNSHGDWGTLVTTHRSLHFVVWSYPLPPVEVPRGHRFTKSTFYPSFLFVDPLVPTVFENDDEANLDSDGLDTPEALIKRHV